MNQSKIGKGGRREEEGGGSGSLGARPAGFGNTAFGCRKPGKNAASPGVEEVRGPRVR